MANAIVASSRGKDYQARTFWLQVCRLLDSQAKVVSVGFESDNNKSFDDVAVSYGPGMRDEHGNALQSDHYSVKFHVDQSGEFTYRSLISPAFINAKSVSFLERLRRLQERLAPDGIGARFFIASPWRVAPSDQLGELYDSANGSLRLDRLREGKTNASEMGEVRAAWRKHLELDSDEDLYKVLRPLRIDTQYTSLAALTNELNVRLCHAGLLPIVEGRLATLYDDLPFKLTGAGRKEFTRDELLDIAGHEGLLAPPPLPKARQVGVRSFMRGAEKLDEVAKPLACLVHCFDGRRVRDFRLWHETIMPEVQRVATDVIQTSGPHHIHMPAHLSIVFAMGHCLDPKVGADVAPIQPGPGGATAWSPDRTASFPFDNPIQTSSTLIDSDAQDVAVAVGITHDIGDDVEHYVREKLPSVRRVLRIRSGSGVGNAAVHDATHALHLAQAIASVVRQRSLVERSGVLHLFFASPKALVFFLGQESRSFGRTTLYEYDQEANTPAAYVPAIALPHSVQAHQPPP